VARKAPAEGMTPVGDIIADAFGGEPDPEDEDAVEGAVERLSRTAYVEDDILPGEPAAEPGAVRIGATLQDAKVATATNGANYIVTFETGIIGHHAISDAMTTMGTHGFIAEFDKFLLGEGATIRSVSGRCDADGAAHFKFSLHFAQSEIARSLGRISDLLSKHAVLTLEPTQGTLRLLDGRDVDLTAKAE
jgi:hypothetical protein